MSPLFLLPSDELHNQWKGRSICNTVRLNILPSACPPDSLSLSPWSALFYSWVQAEFNKYMQMCAAEHDEFKSVCAALWALVRLRLRADPGLIIFHFPIAFNSAAASVRVCVCLGVRMCLGVGISEWVSASLCLCVLLIQREASHVHGFLNRSVKIKSFHLSYHWWILNSKKVIVVRANILPHTYLLALKPPHDLLFSLLFLSSSLYFSSSFREH